MIVQFVLIFAYCSRKLLIRLRNSRKQRTVDDFITPRCIILHNSYYIMSKTEKQILFNYFTFVLRLNIYHGKLKKI